MPNFYFTTFLKNQMMIPRWSEKELQAQLACHRIVSVVGPRQSGKTTLVRNAEIGQAEYRNLDRKAEFQAAKESPAFFLTHHHADRLVIDEVQKVPELIGEMKYIVDNNPTPGQYIITGSADYRKLPHANESLAGRAGFVRMRTLTVAETKGKQPVFLERMFNRELPFSCDKEECNKVLILNHALQGGFPELLSNHDADMRYRWFHDYIENQVILDLRDQWAFRRADLLRDLFPYIAAYSSKLNNVRGVSNQMATSWKTLSTYFNALEAMYIVDMLPAWSHKDYDRAGKVPKMFMTDSGLMAYLLGISTVDQLTGMTSEAADQSGKLVETWVYNQLASEMDLHPRWKMMHFRYRNYREIDFLIQNEKGGYLGIEVKTAETLDAKDFADLKWFSEQPAIKDFTGIVFYAGNMVTSPAKRLYGIPMASMWLT